MDKFSYRVILKNIIDSSNNKIITYLYQPIMGSKAVSLYYTLINESHILSEFKKITLSEVRLAKITGISQSTLPKYFKKLEALGLLRTLENKDKSTIIFNIYSPLEPISFFENKVFNNALISKLKKDDYELVRFTFRDEGELSLESGYKDTSSKFAEVFGEIENLKLETNKMIQAKPKRSNALLKGLDYTNLLTDLETDDVIISGNNQLVKKAIEDVFGSYNISQYEIKEVIKKIYQKETCSFDNSLFYKEISKIVFDREEFDVTIPEFNTELHIKNQKNKKLSEMETIDPEEYLLALLKTKSPAIKELNKTNNEIIEVLQNKYKLRNGVINCLFDFVFLKNKGQIVPNYIYKIASTMAENNFKTASETLEYLKVAHQKSKAKIKSNTNNQITLNSKWQDALNKETYKVDVNSTLNFDEKGWGDF
ncbi:DnaD domain protein [Spiroplasma diminutum]|uniref:Chromosome replication initiation and membrane attachment protein n=1 Tax=Spiroplasma diminutum CUAS-1 TaxID=1276221 RepID=S5MKA5_9MOLU|nr:DnaD domain protein [Spiroplasma diminutum]AGR42410.1 chromosome replication initiation and membrane attachment protein [Spiroplasma diminutum CUAS-1]